MASAGGKMLSAEERRRQRELEEARKAGLAPAEVRRVLQPRQQPCGAGRAATLSGVLPAAALGAAGCAGDSITIVEHDETGSRVCQPAVGLLQRRVAVLPPAAAAVGTAV